MSTKKAELHLKLHLKKPKVVDKSGTGAEGDSLPEKKRTKRRRGRLSVKGFTLFRRKGSKTWYFYAVENGKRAAHSTKTEDEDRAREIAAAYLRPKAKEAAITLEQFTADFFVWGKCSWIAAQNAGAGRHVSEGAAIGRRTHLTHWILPTFKSRPVSSITPKELRDWLVALPLSGQSKNHIRYTLKIVFGEAVLAGIIAHNPVSEFKNVAVVRKERDAFTPEDLAKLFPVDRDELIGIWGEPCIAVLFLTLAATGIRSGEARALQWRHVGAEAVTLPDGKQAEIPYLMIEQSVKFFTPGLIGSTKSGKARPVYLPERARGALEWWRENTYGGKGENDLVFPDRNGAKPINEQRIRARFLEAIKRSKIDVGGRNLVPHSFRHAYVTRSKKALPADLLLLMAGHADERVQRGYVHPTIEEHLKEMAAARLLIEGAAKW